MTALTSLEFREPWLMLAALRHSRAHWPCAACQSIEIVPVGSRRGMELLEGRRDSAA